MRRLLLVAALALVAAGARARRRAAGQRARLHHRGRAHRARSSRRRTRTTELPIASITKLMTVLVTLKHHKLTDVVTVDPRAAAVGESSIELDAGEQLTVRDLIKGALIQSANDAADALALSIAPDYPSFATLMNDEAAALGLRDTHFVRPDGLDAPGEYSSAADVTKLARLLMRTRFVRETVGEETDTIAGGRTLHTWDDLLSLYPPTIGVKTGHTNAAGLVPGRGGARPRRDRVRDAARLADARRAERRPRVAAHLGARAVPRRPRRPHRAAPYAEVQVPVRPRAARRSSPPKPLLAVARLGRPLTQTVTAPAVVSLPVQARARCSAASRSGRAAASSARATWSLPARLTSRVCRGG